MSSTFPFVSLLPGCIILPTMLSVTTGFIFSLQPKQKVSPLISRNFNEACVPDPSEPPARACNCQLAMDFFRFFFSFCFVLFGSNKVDHGKRFPCSAKKKAVRRHRWQVDQIPCERWSHVVQPTWWPRRHNLFAPHLYSFISLFPNIHHRLSRPAPALRIVRTESCDLANGKQKCS